MSLLMTTKDIPIIIHSAFTRSERRITPSWTVEQLKMKLEHITGIPPSCQKLQLKLPDQNPVDLGGPDENSLQLSRWNLQPNAEIEVEDTRPEGSNHLDFTDTNAVAKYTMPIEEYESLPNSVLAWKRANKLGRFNPNLSKIQDEKADRMWHEIDTRGIEIGKRCQLGEESSRRGNVAFVGEVSEIPGPKGPWVGVILDEPNGKNNGSIRGQVYFRCPDHRGIFVRPDRIEIGDFDVLEDVLDDMEEI